VKILFDHNVPHKLRGSLGGHEVVTADGMGWATLENGQLLDAAEGANFEVMVTCDQNLSYQQDLRGRRIAIVVLSTNNWNIVKRKSKVVVEAVEAAKPGSLSRVKL
jgi:predicted nuclease of predicted toxin-antitoxin system